MLRAASAVAVGCLVRWLELGLLVTRLGLSMQTTSRRVLESWCQHATAWEDVITGASATVAVSVKTVGLVARLAGLIEKSRTLK